MAFSRGRGGGELGARLVEWTELSERGGAGFVECVSARHELVDAEREVQLDLVVDVAPDVVVAAPVEVDAARSTA
jgi:hypothetical protein